MIPAPASTSRRTQRRETYHAGRLALIAAMGGKCVLCGHNSAHDLEFHHKTERTWIARKTSRWVRPARVGGGRNRAAVPLV